MTDANRRPPLAPGVGINVIKLDVERTRDELASTLDDRAAMSALTNRCWYACTAKT